MNTNFNKSFLKIVEHEPRISHRLIAEFTETKQKNVVELILKYFDKFQLFGHLPFETESVINSVGATNQQKTYYLNEPQATLLLSFMRNNAIVIKFKVDLVQAFFEMRRKLQNPISQLPNFSELLSQNEEAKKLVELFEETKPFHLLLLQKLLKENSVSSLFQLDFQNTYFLPTELGKLHGISGREANLLLEKRGLQEKQDEVWKLTESGKEFGMEVGGTYHQLKWKLETL